MRRTATLLTVLVSGTPGVVAPANQMHRGDDARPRSTCETERRLVVTWVDTAKLIPETGSLEKEVQKIFEPMDISIEWRAYSGRRGPSETEPEVHVHLKNAHPKRWGLRPRAMGVVYEGAKTDRRIYVFFPAIASTLGYRSATLERLLRQRAPEGFTRALSRVIAHEIVHSLAPALPHGQSGLTSQRLTRRDLLAKELEIELAAAVSVPRGLARLCETLNEGATLTRTGGE